MKKKILKILELIKKLFMIFEINLQVTRLTSNKDLMKLIKKLRPLKINKNLIRLGPSTDGGYLVPNDLDGIQALFSPGVGMKSSFELDCANRGMKVFMADASVEGPLEKHQLFKFEKKFVGAINNTDFITLESWIENAGLPSNSDLLLQMDIEGFEYEVIFSIPIEKIKRFRIIIIEFHQLDLLWNKVFFEKFKNSFLKLIETHYVAHIHPNNAQEPVTNKKISIPPVMEFTFIRKDRVKTEGYNDNFPHPLDATNTKKRHFDLPACWYED